MTQPHVGPGLEAPDLGAAIAALRARGLRVSVTRRLMLEVLYGSDRPLSAERLAARIGGVNPDVASVYRNLEVLEQTGLVRHFHLGHSPGLYVRVGAGVREYLVCESCQVVESVPIDALDPVREELRSRFGWEARFTHSPIVGLCPECSGRAGLELAQSRDLDGEGEGDASA